jgi:4-hydroxy-tetrahydrodipicolinate reductase
VIVAQARLAFGIHGACGRMGRRLIQLASDDPSLELTASLDRHDHPQIGQDAGSIAGVAPLGVKLAGSLADSAKVDVVIDFSLPAGTLKIAELCQARDIALVVGTTGFTAGQRATLESVATRIPLFVSPNMSWAVNVLMRLVASASASLGPACDIAIVERHHRTKKDAPSGTALRLGDYVQKGLGSWETAAEGKQGGDQATHQIDFHALRLGDSAGEHTVIFGMPGEVIELTHRASNRDGFARGALNAAKFLAGKPAGLYSMEDLLA